MDAIRVLRTKGSGVLCCFLLSKTRHPYDWCCTNKTPWWFTVHWFIYSNSQITCFPLSLLILVLLAPFAAHCLDPCSSHRMTCWFIFEFPEWLTITGKSIRFQWRLCRSGQKKLGGAVIAISLFTGISWRNLLEQRKSWGHRYECQVWYTRNFTVYAFHREWIAVCWASSFRCGSHTASQTFPPLFANKV